MRPASDNPTSSRASAGYRRSRWRIRCTLGEWKGWLSFPPEGGDSADREIILRTTSPRKLLKRKEAVLEGKDVESSSGPWISDTATLTTNTTRSVRVTLTRRG